MAIQLTGVKDVDDIILDYKYGMEHKKKYKKVMKQLCLSAGVYRCYILNHLLKHRQYTKQKEDDFFLESFRFFCVSVSFGKIVSKDDSDIPKDPGDIYTKWYDFYTEWMDKERF